MDNTRQELVSYAVLYDSYILYTDHFPNHDAFHQLIKFKIFDGDWDQLKQNWGPGCTLYDELLKDVKIWEESFERVQTKARELELSEGQLVNFIELCLELFMKVCNYHSVYDFSNIWIENRLDQNHRSFNEFKFFDYLNQGFGEERVFNYLIEKGNIENLKKLYHVNSEELENLLERYNSDGLILGKDALTLMTSFESQINGDIKVALGGSEHFFSQSFDYEYNDRSYTIYCNGRTDVDFMLSYDLKKSSFNDLLREFNSLITVGVVISGLTGVIDMCEYGEWEYYTKSVKIIDSNGQKIEDQELISEIWNDVDFDYLNELIPTFSEDDALDPSIRLGINEDAEFSGFKFL